MATPASQASSVSLRRRVWQAGGWVMAGYALGQAVRLASNLIMTRILAPEMFGLMAIATAVMVMLLLLSDVGLRQSIVRSPRGEDTTFLDSAWVMQIMRGHVLWLIALTLCGALYLANHRGVFPQDSAFADPLLPIVVAVNSFACVIAGFQSTRIALAQRWLDQRRPVQIELVAQLVGLAVMAAAGSMVHSVWVLVAGGLVASALSTALSHAWMPGPRNRLRLDRSAVVELLHFGKWIFPSSALYVLATNGDRLLLGSRIDPQLLGTYSIAVLVVGALDGAFNRLFQAVTLPALSEIARQTPSRMRSVYYRLRLPVDVLLLFLTGLLYAAGPLVVRLLYDARYAAAGGTLAILSLSLIVVRYGIANQIYLSIGRPHYQTVLNAVRFLSLYTIVPPLLYGVGLHAAIWGIALHSFAIVPFVYYFNARLGLNDYRRELAVLPALPVGLAAGYVLNLIAA